MRSSAHAPGPRLTSDDRRFGRLRAEGLRCSIGRVLDLSGGGMRVRTVRDASFVQGTDLGVVIHAEGTPPLAVEARIVWARNTGWRARELGLAFLNLSDRARAALGEFARELTRPDPLVAEARRAA